MKRSKLLLPLFIGISLIFIALWVLADLISLSTHTEILGIWSTDGGVAITALHSWDVTCNNNVTVYYQYTHQIDGVGRVNTPIYVTIVAPPGVTHSETWTTVWYNLQPGNYTARCTTAASAEGKISTFTDSASFTVP